AGADLGAVVRVVLEGLVGGHPLGPALGDLVEGAVALQGVEPVLCAVVVDHGADRAALAARAGAHRDLGVVLGGLTGVVLIAAGAAGLCGLCGGFLRGRGRLALGDRPPLGVPA